MDDFSSTLLILKQNGYTEDVDPSSLPLVAHLLCDLQKLQLERLTFDATLAANEDRINQLLKELGEVDSKYQILRDENETLKRRVGNQDAGGEYSAQEYAELIHTLTMEKGQIEEERHTLQTQLALLRQTLSDRDSQIQTLNKITSQLRKEVTLSASDRSLLRSFQSQISEMQQVYSASQRELQSLRASEQSAKEREHALTLQLAESQHACRLLEEASRAEKTRTRTPPAGNRP
ncbi:uncharacterized protein [Blastocystis hominis]|uniref:Uncharacterized protein n=1 Tax=Blastocystis hominis TaxID=12968 RepID=D8M6J1_BLAHO|nr:uncharacterized protein [Blastocystis hominis]CBK23409.2 unnamed protein product [Blastocystis hominis]|eukprot:XP_012897457.1 uncharacterized protein [Blastocystis hominis]